MPAGLRGDLLALGARLRAQPYAGPGVFSPDAFSELIAGLGDGYGWQTSCVEDYSTYVETANWYFGNCAP